MKLIPGTDLLVPDSDEHFFEQGTDVKTYQHDRVDMALTRLPKTHRRVAIDAGAHVGILTRKLAQHFDKVIAFEPNSVNFECLVANTKHLRNVEAHQKALGDKAGTVAVCGDPADNSGDRRIHLPDEPNGLAIRARGTYHDVEQVTIDSLNLEALDLLKVDVQGYEWYVLQGAANTIRYCRPVCIVEVERKKRYVSPFAHTSQEAVAQLKSWGAEVVGQISADYIQAFPPSDNIPFDKYVKAGAYHWDKYESSRWTVDLVDTVVGYIRAKGHTAVLDVGCGDGLFTKLLGEGAYGIDNSDAGIALARERGVDCRAMSAFDVLDLKARWDAVCLFDTLEHAYDQARLIGILGQVTNRIYILNPEPAPGTRPDRFHTREFTAQGLADWMNTLGWSRVHIQEWRKTAENRKSFQEFLKK